MKRFIMLLPRRFLTLLLSCCLMLGITSSFLPINPILPLAYAETVVVDNALFSAEQTQQYAETMPYWIWLVLPRIFPEYLDDKGGYLSLGFQWKTGEETPVGIAKDNGNRQEILACNGCHTGNSPLITKTSTVDGVITPKVTFNHQRYHQFLVNCVQDPRFTADYILPVIEYNHQLSFWEKQYYRWSLIPKIKKQLLAQVAVDSISTSSRLRPTVFQRLS